MQISQDAKMKVLLLLRALKTDMVAQGFRPGSLEGHATEANGPLVKAMLDHKR